MNDLMENKPDEPHESVSVVEAPSAIEQVGALYKSARELVEIELDFYRARLSYSQKMLKRAGLFGVLALSFLLTACVAFVLGMLLIIASHLGPEAATLCVTITFIGLAILFALLARSHARKLGFPELSGDSTDEPG
jgi:hypothetical protein